MPAYSMGKAPKERTYLNQLAGFIQNNSSPGVGTYPIQKWDKTSRSKASPSMSMTKTRKFFDSVELNNDIQASPCSYNPEKPHVNYELTKSKTTISITGKPKIHYRTNVPSPTTYNPSHNFSARMYSFTKSIRKIKTEQGPGPCNYTVNVIPEKGVTFSKENRDNIHIQNTPGPGTYCKTEESAQNTTIGAEFSFSKTKKFATQETEEKVKGKIPGPGSYSIGEFKKKFRGGKFTSGERMSIISQGPGPSAYSPMNIKQKGVPKAIIGTQKRDTRKINDSPGPGSYESSNITAFKKKDGIAVFSQDSRMKNRCSLTPGPGSYDTKKLMQSRCHSISVRHPQQKIQKTPGPQDYNPQYKNTQKSEGCLKFGSEDRLKRVKTETPGPGQYCLESKRMNKTFYFNKARKIDKLNSTVGPGQYKLKPFIGVCDGLEIENDQILYV